jgi:predicted O-methyltransferase YrrM
VALLRQIARRAKRVAGAAIQPPYMAAGHFYSPLTSNSDIERALKTSPSLAGIDLRENAQLDLLRTMAPLWRQRPRGRYDTPGNSMFPSSDAAVLSALIRMVSPKQIIEVGSGYSSAVMLDTRHEATHLTFVEPYPARLQGLIRPGDKNWELVQSPVQETGLELFRRLNRDDILFIDSTHVIKAGSDVGYLLFQVLPNLASGVLVHFHDIFYAEYGLGYQEGWLREHRDWNEAYFLQAFLMYSSGYEIVLFNDYVWRMHSSVVKQYLPETLRQRPGGIWLRKII